VGHDLRVLRGGPEGLLGEGVGVDSGGELGGQLTAALVREGDRIRIDAAAQAGVDLTRIDEAIKVIVEQFARMADETVGSEELEKSRSMIKGRFVLRTEGPQGLIMYGLNREVLEGKTLEPAELLAKIDAKGGPPFNLSRAIHRKEHLDEIEPLLRS